MPDSQLPPCRSTLSCYTTSRSYDRVPHELFEAAIEAIRDLSGFTIGSAVRVETDPDLLWLSADFRVFLFTDDLDLQVEARDDGAVVHVRSASRVGRGDLGTNRRRVEALFEELDDIIAD